MRRLALAVLVLAAPAAAQQGYPKGDPEQGARLAARLCAECHDIRPGGKFREYPPSFAAIADYRDRGQIMARIFFPPVDSAMPQMGRMLSPAQVNDITSYIQSLAGTARR